MAGDFFQRMVQGLKKHGPLFLFFLVLVIASRLFMIFRMDGHCDATALFYSGKKWLEEGIYQPGRWPGSPAYEVVVGILGKASESFGWAYFILPNLFSCVSVALFLLFLYYIFCRGLSSRASLVAAVLFNFYPSLWFLGGSTVDINPYLALQAGAFLLFLNGRLLTATLVAALSCSMRIQGVSLLLPLILLIAYRAFRDRDWQKLLWQGVVVLAWGLFLFSPLLFHYQGLGFLRPPPSMGSPGPVTLTGAFLFRTINMFGPLGVLIFLYLGVKERGRLLDVFRSVPGFVLGLHLLVTLVIFWATPYEIYYLLAIVPVFFYWVFLGRRLWHPIVVAFAISMLLPSFVQLQVRFWKAPFMEIREGMIPAHLKKDWIGRSGG